MRNHWFAVSILTALSTGTVFGQNMRHPADGEPPAGCGTFRYERNRVGPMDYRISPQDWKDIVENVHFTPDVESLRRGKSGTIGGDIAYTLNAFPNHYRALRSAAEYERRHGVGGAREMGHSTVCWFERAVAFRNSDATVRILYASELLRRGNKRDAAAHLAVAEEHGAGNTAVAYNLGLLYFDLDDHERSLRYAKEAYAGGMTLPGLRDKLMRAGKWQD